MVVIMFAVSVLFADKKADLSWYNLFSDKDASFP
jgi:hypothetical protein